MTIQSKKTNKKDFNEIRIVLKRQLLLSFTRTIILNKLVLGLHRLKKKKNWKSILEKQLFLVVLFWANIISFEPLENGGSIDFLLVNKDYLKKELQIKIL